MDPVLADPDARRLLNTIYRVRPGTVGELRALQGLPRDRIPELLQRLAAAGLITVDGDTIEAVSPDRAMATAAEQVVKSEREALHALAVSAGALSALTRDWEVGSSPDDTAPWAEFVHGHEAQWKAWPRYAVTHPPRNPVNLYPDLRILRDVMVATMTEDEKRLVASAGLRGVFPRSILSDPDDRAFLDELRRLGALIRIAEEVPSWVYADRGLLCALPLDWAEHPPSSIAIVTHPSITEIVSLYVESIWDKAVDYPLVDDGWQPVLRLLARGLSDAAIAQSLDISPRTVHRRIAEAMEQLDAHSRFELGVAWARAVERDPRADARLGRRVTPSQPPAPPRADRPRR
ncbi:MAG TPA: helix-turn-helix transcriptional regulator [Pseudolysinimonas sp.]|nr:helix-turn-helix transcriptional regulator [Pseudolysinimonas sp.]